MSTVLATPAPTGNAPKAAERHVLLLEPPSADTDGWFAFEVRVTRRARTEVSSYLAREIPAGGMGAGCRGFEVEKLGADLLPTGTVYHVLLDPRDGYSSCDCLGGLHHGHCKHREALQALAARLKSLKSGELRAESREPEKAKTTKGVSGSPRSSLRAPPPSWRSGGDMAANDPDAFERHMRSLAYDPRTDGPEDDADGGRGAPEPWDYPDEMPELPYHADYEPGEEGPEPEPNRAA